MKIHMNYREKKKKINKNQNAVIRALTELKSPLSAQPLPPAVFRRRRKWEMWSAELPAEGRFAAPAAPDRRTVRHGRVSGTWQGMLRAGSCSRPQLPPLPCVHSIRWSQGLQGGELTWKVWWQRNREREKFCFLLVAVKRGSEGCKWVFEMKQGENFKYSQCVVECLPRRADRINS